MILLEEGESSDDELPLDDESSSGDATILDQEDEGDHKIGEVRTKPKILQK